MVWGFRWLKFFLHPFTTEEFEHISESDRRSYILGRLEGAAFSEWSWVVVVAGVGFFTDAYSIFAINMVIPMLGIIYYGGSMPHNYEIALSVVTLGGSIIGQIGFGLGADLWGRRKMYGLELIITISATLGMVMSSSGIEGSMSLIVWLLVWRFVLGIGIGADYPLSAVICSEFAPTRLRGRMLTLVFACQPIGQLAATLVSLIAVVRQRDGLPSDSTPTSCNVECRRTLDSVWRWIIGVGVIPSIIALWFRLTIIESPRYTADVGRDSRKAASELKNYLLIQAQTAAPASISSISLDEDHQEEYEMRRQSSGAASGVASDAGSGVASGAASIQEDISPPQNGDVHGLGIKNIASSKEVKTTHIHLRSGAASLDGPSPGTFSPAQFDQQPSWHNPGGNDVGVREEENTEQDAIPPAPSWKEFKSYFWHDGNLRTLLATSFCWFCLDLPFYGLGMNSPKIITTIWYGKKQPVGNIYSVLIDDIWQSLIVVSLGAILGCAITFVAIDKLGRRTIQIVGFFWLFVLFIIIGGSFNHLYEIGGSPAIIVLYILCQIFFNFGPNTTTYIMPAELFPTRYRGLCHGISAAFGKLGSVVAQLFLAYINYGRGVNYNTIQKWLPYSLLIFSIFMLLGLLTTVWYIPGAEHGPDGQVKTLEDWAVGRETPNRFAEHRLAKAVEWCWKKCAKVVDSLILCADWAAGGEERERRNQVRMAEEHEREMNEIAERHREEIHNAQDAEVGHVEDEQRGRENIARV